MTLDAATIARAPKVVLHDHLDGGLRPSTLIELAADIGYQLPESDPERLGEWFARTASSGSLPDYLTTFDHTIAVLQTAEALSRVAEECVLDLAADGVVYAESRIAPEQHLRAGLTLDDVVVAVQDGLMRGEQAAASQGRTIRTGILVTAMRHADRGREIAELAVRHRDRGAVGFDIAGAEAGFPATRLADAFDLLRGSLMHFTIHAGEAAGPQSMADALSLGAERIGHGVRVVEDIEGLDQLESVPDLGGRTRESVRLGRVAQYVLDRQIPLELCPSSNVQTGAVASLAAHPFDLLRWLGFNVTVNTDNRLMSATTMTQEMAILVDRYGYGMQDLAELTVRALDAGFAARGQREALLQDVVLPGYQELV